MEAEGFEHFDFIMVREKITKFSKRQCDEFMSSLKEAADNAAGDENKFHPKQLFYMLHLMALYLIKFVDVDTWKFEEIYIKLINEDIHNLDASFPFEYRIEFLFQFCIIFNNNGYFTKSEAAFDKIKALYELNNENVLIAERYINAYLSKCFDIWSISFETPEQLFKDIDEVIKIHSFTNEQLLEFEYQKTRILLDFYILSDIAESKKHHNRLTEISKELKSVFHLYETCYQLLSFCAKMPDEIDVGVSVFDSLFDIYLKDDCEDYENNYAYMHLKILKFFMHAKQFKKEESIKLFNETIKTMEIHGMSKYAILNYEISMSLLLFNLDPELISQGRLFQMRKMFTEIVEIIEDEKSRYKISYILSNMYGLVVQIQKVMGIQVDPKLPLKYEKGYEGDKLSYISFFSSLEPFQDPDIKPCLIKALSYCEEYNIPKFHRMRFNIETLIIEIELYSQNLTDQANARSKIDNLIKEVKESSNKESMEANLLALYYTYLVYLEAANDLLKFNEIAEEYLELAVKHNESPDFTCAIFQKSIYSLFRIQNFEKANYLAERQLLFLEPYGKASKIYADALYTAFTVKRTLKDFEFMIANIDSLLESNKLIYGEKSPQYIEAVKEMAITKMTQYQTNEAYKFWLKAYDLSKEVYDSELNNMSTGILVEMAAIKCILMQYEEALNLVDKAKKIEEQMSSIYSNMYKVIQNFEKEIRTTQERIEGYKKKPSFFKKLWPNTKLKKSLYVIGIAAISIGVYYLSKKKRID